MSVDRERDFAMQRKLRDLTESEIRQEALILAEYGYRECEKGRNLQQVLKNAKAILEGKSIPHWPFEL